MLVFAGWRGGDPRRTVPFVALGAPPTYCGLFIGCCAVLVGRVSRLWLCDLSMRRGLNVHFCREQICCRSVWKRNSVFKCALVVIWPFAVQHVLLWTFVGKFVVEAFGNGIPFSNALLLWFVEVSPLQKLIWGGSGWENYFPFGEAQALGTWAKMAYSMNAFIYLSLRFTKYLDEVFMKANILHLET